MRCDICNKELGIDKRPVEYCDYQQGRCPHQKHAFDWNNKFDRFLSFSIMAGLFFTLFFIIYISHF